MPRQSDRLRLRTEQHKPKNRKSQLEDKAVYAAMQRDGSADHNAFAPVSMYFRETEWTEDEMFEIMKEIAETTFRYYVF